MATSEERLKILQMIQDGKISAADGAKLLEALTRGSRSAGGRAAAEEARTFRIRVTDTFTGRNKVSVNLPLGLVNAGISIASKYAPGVEEADLLEAINSGLVGKVMDVIDEEDGEHIEIFIE